MTDDRPKRRPGRPRTRDEVMARRAIDPVGSLSPTGRRILDAARRVLERDGFAALSLSAVAAEADESKTSIGYHFGNKDGLIVALIDSLVHEANRGYSPGAGVEDGDRVPALLDDELKSLEDRRSFATLLEVLPHALRRAALRDRVADLYDGYRDAVLGTIDSDAGLDRAKRASFAALTIAVVDGLSIQRGLDPQQVDVEAAAALWLGIGRALLEPPASAGAAGDEPSAA